jgi:hypothetical protein
MRKAKSRTSWKVESRGVLILSDRFGESDVARPGRKWRVERRKWKTKTSVLAHSLCERDVSRF